MGIFSRITADGMLNSAVTLLVGLIALVVYWITKRHELRNAATVIVMDIRHAEQAMVSLLERNLIDKGIKTILYENNWAKYKHLFASKLSTDEFGALNKFYESCVEIAEAKRRMNELFYTAVNAKAVLLQEKILGIEDLPSQAGQEKRATLIQIFNSEAHVFEPDDFKGMVIKNMNLLGRPSTGTAFVKLRKIARLRD